MSRHNRRVMTFSVGFREGRYSELPYAATVARHFDTHHHELLVYARGHHGAPADAGRACATRRCPNLPMSPSTCWRARPCAASKMVLTGEGSDELLGGYPKHVMEQYAQRFQSVPRALRRGLLAPLVQALPYRFRPRQDGAGQPEHRELAGAAGALVRRARITASAGCSAAGERPPRPAGGLPPFDGDPRPVRCAASCTSTRPAGCPTTCWSAPTA